MRLTTIFAVMLVLLLSACASDAPIVPVGPVLLEQHTLEPTLSVPTRIGSDHMPDSILSDAEQTAVPQVEFVFTTPTIPPTKTPTAVPSPIPTETLVPITIPAETIRPTVALFPTSVIIPVAPPTIAPVGSALINPNQPSYVVPPPSYGVPVDPSGIQQPVVVMPTSAMAPTCQMRWFFVEPRPLSCPVAMPTTAHGVFQAFEHGQMIWLSTLNVVYVMYNDAIVPRWQVFRDEFQDGMPEQDGQYIPPSPNLWQPRRGFGLVWRNHETVRARLGWAIQDIETSYEIKLQQSNDNTLFMTDPSNYLYGLFYGGNAWERYAMIPSN